MNYLHFLKGLPFLIRYSMNIFEEKIIRKKIELPSKLKKGKSYITFIYQKKQKPRTCTPILLAHGMGARGIEDSRIVELAVHLALAGYTVYTPEYEEIKQLKIVKDSIDNIKDSYLSLLTVLESPPAFVSVSLSGGMGLVAMSTEPIRHIVPAIFLIGPYSNFSHTIPFVMKNADIDNYGCFAFLHNYIHLIKKDSQNLSKVFLEMALDNGLNRTGSNGNKLINSILTESEKEFYYQICDNKKFRLQIAEEISNTAKNLEKELSPYYYVQNIQAPIAILHGKGDPVISEQESVQLAEKLKRYGKDYLLVINRLISHGDRASIYSQITEIPTMAEIFGYFFSKYPS